MPVRSLNSAVLKWPSKDAVHSAAKAWATRTAKANAGVLRIGYFGSYATDDWGVGSDLDIVVILESSELPFETRSTKFPTSSIPVPCDVLVYTRDEWTRLAKEGTRFARTVEAEAVWLYANR